MKGTLPKGSIIKVGRAGLEVTILADTEVELAHARSYDEAAEQSTIAELPIDWSHKDEETGVDVQYDPNGARVEAPQASDADIKAAEKDQKAFEKEQDAEAKKKADDEAKAKGK